MTKIKDLGQGRYGKVELREHKTTKYQRAVKTVLMDPAKEKQERYLRETKVLRNMNRHERIVKYYHSSIKNNILYIHMEYLPGGSLDNMLEKDTLSEKQAKRMLKQILEGVAFLHCPIHVPEKGAEPVSIIHRDLKCQNILLTNDQQNVKLCDFGTSKFLSDVTSTVSKQNRVGTEKFMAPELFDDEIKVTISADIWSIGCVLVQMLTKNPPWGDITDVQLVKKIVFEKKYPTYTLPDNVSEHVEDFLQLCFKYNPNERPSAGDLLKHPFITQDDQASL